MGTCTSPGNSGAIDADRVSAVANCIAGRLEACLPVSPALVRQIYGLRTETRSYRVVRSITDLRVYGTCMHMHVHVA
jgi:hypothetical protein